MLFHNIISIVCTLSLPVLVSSAGSIVSDFRIRNKDLSPSIGRGYSVGSGNIMALCFSMSSVNDITEPSFDYQYVFKEINMDVSQQISETLTSTQGWGNIQTSVQKTIAKESDIETKTQKVWAFMGVDKYYISADESKTVLNDFAKDILGAGKFIQFFQACGPSFIRSIRRASEFHGIFSYKTQVGSVKETVSYLKKNTSNNVDAGDSSAKIDLESNEVTIEMKAYGVSLPGKGHGFMARTFEAYGKAMDYAFTAMMNPHSGFIRSIEVVPWVNNVQFQAASRMEAQIDGKHSYLRRFYTIVNAEHVARLDEILRNRMTIFNMIVFCIGTLNAFPLDADGKLLKDKYAVCDLGGACEPNVPMTVRQLKLALQRLMPPAGGAGSSYLIERYSLEMNDFLEYYMGPCLTEMSNTSGGAVGGAMQVKHWSSMEGCNKISCVFTGTKWNDTNQKCERSAEVDDVSWIVERFCPASLQIFTAEN